MAAQRDVAAAAAVAAAGIGGALLLCASRRDAQREPPRQPDAPPPRCQEGCARPRRVLVIGAPGSGKSTLARALGAACGLPVTHIDRLYYEPGQPWVYRPDAAVAADISRQLAKERWVFEGNHEGKGVEAGRRCQLVVYLDLPPALVRCQAPLILLAPADFARCLSSVRVEGLLPLGDVRGRRARRPARRLRRVVRPELLPRDLGLAARE